MRKALTVELRCGIESQEWQYLTGWKERVFPEEGRGMQWVSTSWHVMAFAEDGKPVGHVGFDKFEVQVEDQPRQVVGVGGVVVRPEFQGQGVPALLFKTLHESGRDLLSTDVYTLFCPTRLVTYYNRHGYEQHLGEVRFMQRGEMTKSSFEFMHRGAAIAPSARIELTSPPW